MFMMLLNTADVLGRYVFNKPVQGTHDLMEPLMAIIVLVTLAYTERTGLNVGIDILEEQFKKRGRSRTIRGFNLFNLLFPFLLFVIVTYSSWNYFWKALESNDFIVGIITLPSAPILVWVPVGSFLLCLRLFTKMVNEVRSLIRGQEIIREETRPISQETGSIHKEGF